MRVLQDKTGFTVDKLIEAAYDSYLTAFENTPSSILVKAYDGNFSTWCISRKKLAARWVSERLGFQVLTVIDTDICSCVPGDRRF
ncbi:MAG: hypothetical protein R2744_08740 [Bacteroidales bacterium]